MDYSLEINKKKKVFEVTLKYAYEKFIELNEARDTMWGGGIYIASSHTIEYVLWEVNPENGYDDYDYDDDDDDDDDIFDYHFYLKDQLSTPDSLKKYLDWRIPEDLENLGDKFLAPRDDDDDRQWPIGGEGFPFKSIEDFKRHVDYDQICRIAYLAWGGFSRESFEKHSSIELLNNKDHLK